jgi:hypothetical protein
MTFSMKLLSITVIFGILVLSVSPAVAQDPEVREHKVWIWQETGDCLWNIAKKYYGDPFKWRIIYETNKHFISDPRVIFPKQILEIPSLESISKKTVRPKVTEVPPESPEAESDEEIIKKLIEEEKEKGEEIFTSEEITEESAWSEEEIFELEELMEESTEDEEESFFE